MSVPPGGFMRSAICGRVQCLDRFHRRQQRRLRRYLRRPLPLLQRLFHWGDDLLFRRRSLQRGRQRRGCRRLAAEIQRKRGILAAPAFTGPNAVSLVFHDASDNPVGGVVFSIVAPRRRSRRRIGQQNHRPARRHIHRSRLATSGTLWSDTTITVTGNATFTIVGTAITIPAPANPSQTTAYLTTRDGQGTAVPNTTLTFQLIDPQAATDSYNQDAFAATSNSSALLQVPLLQNTKYQARVGSGAWVSFTTGSGGTFPLPEILGPQ